MNILVLRGENKRNSRHSWWLRFSTFGYVSLCQFPKYHPGLLVTKSVTIPLQYLLAKHLLPRMNSNMYIRPTQASVPTGTELSEFHVWMPALSISDWTNQGMLQLSEDNRMSEFDDEHHSHYIVFLLLSRRWLPASSFIVHVRSSRLES
jgi:hypothetical protein